MKRGDMVRVKNPYLKLYHKQVFLCLNQHFPMWEDEDEGDPPTHMNVLDSRGNIMGFSMEDLEVIR
jgi:hypothetical protein